MSELSTISFTFVFLVCLKLHFLLCVLSAVCVHDTLTNRADAAPKAHTGSDYFLLQLASCIT